ncbi:MAG TPA: aldolase [Methanoregulaceae archaeon]|nr:aldolase [Methanoregulaceae archaeon]
MYSEEFRRIGKRLFSEGLVGGNFGNMSTRSGDGFLITRTGSYLDDPGDLVFVPLEGAVPPEASSEYRVHREIYKKTRHHAIVHAHPAHAVALSLVLDEIIPRDSEGELLCPVIPVVLGKPGSDELALTVSDALRLSKLAIASGHGTFAAGKSLDEAYLFTSLGEHACTVLMFLTNLH